MLDFWYSERCTREMKLTASAVICFIIYACSSFEKLSTALTLFSLAAGASVHLLRTIGSALERDHPYARGIHILCLIVPLACMIAVICHLPDGHKLLTAIQALGFGLLGLFVTSIYANRAKRFD